MLSSRKQTTVHTQTEFNSLCIQKLHLIPSYAKWHASLLKMALYSLQDLWKQIQEMSDFQNGMLNCFVWIISKNSQYISIKLVQLVDLNHVRLKTLQCTTILKNNSSNKNCHNKNLPQQKSCQWKIENEETMIYWHPSSISHTGYYGIIDEQD